MSVMSCSKKDCENIMCDTYIPSVGYICSECKDEFKIYIRARGVVLDSQESTIFRLGMFMHVPKNYYSDKITYDIDVFFNEYTN